MNVVTINNGHTVVKAERILYAHLDEEDAIGNVCLHIVMEDGYSSSIAYRSEGQAIRDFAVIQCAMQECAKNKCD